MLCLCTLPFSGWMLTASSLKTEACTKGTSVIEAIIGTISIAPCQPPQPLAHLLQIPTAVAPRLRQRAPTSRRRRPRQPPRALLQPGGKLRGGSNAGQNRAGHNVPAVARGRCSCPAPSCSRWPSLGCSRAPTGDVPLTAQRGAEEPRKWQRDCHCCRQHAAVHHAPPRRLAAECGVERLGSVVRGGRHSRGAACAAEHQGLRQAGPRLYAQHGGARHQHRRVAQRGQAVRGRRFGATSPSLRAALVNACVTGMLRDPVRRLCHASGKLQGSCGKVGPPAPREQAGPGLQVGGAAGALQRRC